MNLARILTTLLTLHNRAFADFIMYSFSVNHLPSLIISSLHERLMVYISSTLHNLLYIIDFQIFVYLRHFKLSKLKIILVVP